MSPPLHRAEIESSYKIENGRIVSPGKFEGCPIWLPYFWALALEGMGHRHTDRHLAVGADPDDDCDGLEMTTFMIQSGDVHAFPELAQVLSHDTANALTLWEDDNGFVRRRLASGPDECAQCRERFHAKRSDKSPLCAWCR